jgi:hypothetical protein
MTVQLTPAEAMERINAVCAHAWMVRTFLKHAPEFEDEPERMEIPRVIFDFVRALEGRRAAGNAAGYLEQARRKLHRLRKVADGFARERANISAHTNFEQAALSLSACVRQMEEILAAVATPVGEAAAAQSEPDLPDAPASADADD